MRLPLLAQGPDWVVIAKPPNLLVHRSEWTPHEPAVVQSLRDQLNRLVYPIHRLDRQASGCLLVATAQEAAGPLTTAFLAGRKQYLAMVRGAFPDDGPVEIDKPMRDDGGVIRDAHSTVWCLGRSEEPRCSLLLVEPTTGRYHQVRRHVRDLNHPILGDGDHGDRRINREWRARGVERLALHCVAIRMTLPNGELLSVESPLFEDQARIWAEMPWWESARIRMPLLGTLALSLRDRTAP